MVIKSKMLFVLIGDDKTGKTTLQKLLIEKLTDKGWYEKLPTNQKYNIIHPEIKRKYQTISFANRSIQEKLADYLDVDNYFKSFFTDADIAFVSSHLIESDVKLIIENGRSLFFNVIGVFWSNSIPNPINRNISALDWNERLVIENPFSDDEKQIDYQLNRIAENFVTLIANRTSIS